MTNDQMVARAEWERIKASAQPAKVCRRKPPTPTQIAEEEVRELSRRRRMSR